MTMHFAAHTRFTLPAELSAAEPPERRGVGRADVRLLVADRARLVHSHFTQLPGFLEPGDLLVVNTSATIPAAVDGVRRDGSSTLLHFSTALDDGSWVVEVRSLDGKGPDRTATRGEVITVGGGATITLERAHPDRSMVTGSRLWVARASTPVHSLLTRHGRPISYDYVPGHWPLEDYQTVFARHAGSAEMPSAGRPFTHALVTELVSRGIVVAPLVLHAGVSSLEAGELPQPERYDVPAPTARLVQQAQSAGGRVIAVGTTVARALESAVRPDGSIGASSGWTELILGPDRPARVVDGIITGWHAPDASHLLLLEAVAGPALVRTAYAAALAERYLWHEFGDSALLLSPTAARSLAQTA